MRAGQGQHDIACPDAQAQGRPAGWSTQGTHRRPAGLSRSVSLKRSSWPAMRASSTAPASCAAGERAQVEPAHQLGEVALGSHPALGKQDDRGGEARDLGHGMADIDDGHRHLVAQPLDVGQDLLLAAPVERGQRLVHEQEARARRAAPGRSPRAASRRPTAGRAARREAADAEQVDDLVELARSARAAARASGRRAGSGAPSDAGRAGLPGRRSRCGGDAAARRCRWRVSSEHRAVDGRRGRVAAGSARR